MRGHAEVREFLDFLLRAFPDFTFEAVGGPLVAADGPRAAFWWRGQATNSGPIDPPGMPATGRRIEFEGADFHEYREGKVARVRIVFDMADLSRQMGLLPKQGGAGERAMVVVQHLRARFRRR
jgi:predicted ester cyclase